MKKSNNFVAFLVLLALALAVSVCSARNVAAGKMDDTYLMLWGCSASSNRGLCLSYLRSDHRSYNAKSYIQLGAIMVDFARAKANETLAFVTTLAGGTKDKNVLASFDVCRRQYSRIISEQIPKAIRTIPMNLEEASRMVGGAVGAEEECEKALLKNMIINSPVIDMNSDFDNIAIIAQDLWFLVWG